MKQSKVSSPFERFQIACKLFMDTNDIRKLVQLGRDKAMRIMLELKTKEKEMYEYEHTSRTVRGELVLDYFKIDKSKLLQDAANYQTLVKVPSNYA